MSLKKMKRREQVYDLLIKGKTEGEIAEILKVSRKTIVRDVAYLKESSLKWASELVGDGAIYECKLALEKLKSYEFQYNQILENTTDVDLSIKILKRLEENAIAQAQFVLEGPTLYAVKRMSYQISIFRSKNQ